MGGRGQSMASSKGGIATPNGNINKKYKPLQKNSVGRWTITGKFSYISNTGELAIDGRNYENGKGVDIVDVNSGKTLFHTDEVMDAQTIASNIPQYGMPISYNQIKSNGKDGKYTALGDDGKTYSATYSAELKAMFFAIPASVNVIAYFPKKN